VPVLHAQTAWPSAYTAISAITIDDGSSISLSGTSGQALSIYLANNSQLSVEGGGTLTLADTNSSLSADYGAILNVTGAGSTFTTAGYVSLYTAAALFDQGASVTTNGTTLASYADNIVTIDLRNGATWNAGMLDVGFSGTATVNVASGARLTTGELMIGYDETAHGTVNVAGSGSELNTSILTVGNFGVGALNISDGAHVTSTSAAIAFGSVGTPGSIVGTVKVTGTGSQWIIANDLGIGAYFDNTLSAVGSLTLADGALVKVGATGTGLVSIDRGGTLNIGSGGLAGTLQAGGVAFIPTTGTAALLAFNHTDNITFALPISDRGRLTKAGAGTLTLSGNNTYTQGTTVSGGTLRATNATALGTGSLTLNGGNLELANDSGLAFNRNTTVSADATLTSDRGTTSGAGVTHTLGTLSLGAKTLTTARGSLATSGTGGLTFGATTLSANGAVFDTGANTLLTLGALSGNFSFTKQGAGQLTLGAASTRTGSASTTVSAGTLRLANTSALGTTARTLNLNGGTLQLASNTGSTFNGTNVVLGGDAILTTDRTSSGAGVTHTLGTLSVGASTLTTSRGSLATSGTGGLTFGAVTLTGSPTFSTGTNTQLNLGSVSDGGNAFGFTKSGAGTLVLTADNTFTGGVTLSAGTLQIGNGSSAGTVAGAIANNSALVVNRTGSSTLGGVISGSGSVTHSGSGTLTLSGNNNYEGATSISAGTVVVTRDNALGTAAAGTTVSSGATLALSGGFAYGTAEALTLNTGTTTGGLSNLSGTNSFAGPVTVSGVSRYLVTSGSQLTLSGTLSGSPATSLRNGGTLVLSNSANSFFGALAVNDGTLVATTNGALGNTAGSISVNSGGTLAFSGGIAYSGAKPVTLIGNGVSGRNGALDNLSGDNSFAGPITLSDPVARIGAAAGTTLTLSGVISHAIAGWGPTFAGPGTIKLTGDNTYSGPTALSGGTLEFSALNNLGAGTAVTFNGGTLRYAAGNTADLSARTVTLQSGGAAIDTNGNNVAFASAIGNNGSGALTKLGAGTLTLSAANTYTGGTFVNAGTLKLNGSLANTAVSVASGARLSGSGTLAGTLALASGAILAPGNSPGILNVGDTTLASGSRFEFEINSAVGTAGTNWDQLAINGTLTFAPGATVFIDAVSLLGDNSPGLLAGIQAGQIYTWSLATTTSGIIGFNTATFNVNTDQFLTSIGGTFSVGLGNNGGVGATNSALDLIFTASAIPEPSTYAAFAGLGVLALAAARRRRAHRHLTPDLK
jgi:fibronectin-binding autotransporter adhesin